MPGAYFVDENMFMRRPNPSSNDKDTRESYREYNCTDQCGAQQHMEMEMQWISTSAVEF